MPTKKYPVLSNWHNQPTKCPPKIYIVLSCIAKRKRNSKKKPHELEAQSTEPVSLTFNTEPSIHVDASYQVLVHMATQFQRRRFFRNWPIRNKNCMWWPCLLTDRDKMSNLHRGHSICASYQVSVVAMFANRSGRNEQSSYRTFHRWFLPNFGGSHVC
jgi:hypothetical protein